MYDREMARHLCSIELDLQLYMIKYTNFFICHKNSHDYVGQFLLTYVAVIRPETTLSF